MSRDAYSAGVANSGYSWDSSDSDNMEDIDIGSEPDISNPGPASNKLDQSNGFEWAFRFGGSELQRPTTPTPDPRRLPVPTSVNQRGLSLSPSTGHGFSYGPARMRNGKSAIAEPDKSRNVPGKSIATPQRSIRNVVVPESAYAGLSDSRQLSSSSRGIPHNDILPGRHSPMTPQSRCRDAQDADCSEFETRDPRLRKTLPEDSSWVRNLPPRGDRPPSSERTHLFGSSATRPASSNPKAQHSRTELLVGRDAMHTAVGSMRRSLHGYESNAQQAPIDPSERSQLNPITSVTDVRNASSIGWRSAYDSVYSPIPSLSANNKVPVSNSPWLASDGPSFADTCTVERTVHTIPLVPVRDKGPSRSKSVAINSTTPDHAVVSPDEQQRPSRKFSSSFGGRYISTEEIAPFVHLGHFVDIIKQLYLPPNLPMWQQAVRAAVVLSGTLESWRRGGAEEQVHTISVESSRIPSVAEWITAWLELQPRARFRGPGGMVDHPDALLYPQTQREDWTLFWARAGTLIMHVLLGLKWCSPYISPPRVSVMTAKNWDAWVKDVLWVFHQLLHHVETHGKILNTPFHKLKEARVLQEAYVAIKSDTSVEHSASSSLGPPLMF